MPRSIDVAIVAIVTNVAGVAVVAVVAVECFPVGSWRLGVSDNDPCLGPVGLPIGVIRDSCPLSLHAFGPVHISSLPTHRLQLIRSQDFSQLAERVFATLVILSSGTVLGVGLLAVLFHDDFQRIKAMAVLRQTRDIDLRADEISDGAAAVVQRRELHALPLVIRYLAQRISEDGHTISKFMNGEPSLR